MSKKYTLILLFISTLLQAQPFSGIPSTTGDGACNTKDQYSAPSQNSPDPSNPLYYSKTTVTFYGDSRIDYANAFPQGYNVSYYLPIISSGKYPGKLFSPGLFYGVSSLDFYLGTDSSWNIQNFGHGGDNSDAMLGQITTCLTNKPNYFIAPNVAFEIGGNDYLQNLLMLIYMPWHSQEYVNRALNNIERAITKLYKVRKNVLIIGNYPAVAWSAQRGLPNDDTFAFKTVNYKYQAIMQGFSISNFESFKKTLPELKPILSDALIAYGSYEAILGDLLNGAVITGAGYILNPKQGDYCFGSKIPAHGQIPAYFCWITGNFSSLGTLPSFLMGIQESAYPEIQERRKPYFQAQGLTLDYLRIWEAFVNPATLEPWVVNDALMGDIVHPNAIGFTVWGYHVSSKIKSLGWHLPKTPPVTPPPPPPTDNGGENTGRIEPGPISDWDLILLCFLFGICHL
ncbi:LIC10707 family hydrolase [Leptospira stimsonii]|nr:lipase [Leptospira stimsonii]